MSLVVTPESSNRPPRVRLDLSTPVPDGAFTSISITRNGTLLRVVPPLGDEFSIAYDYEAPYGIPLSYTAYGNYLPPAAPEWTENWASLAAWTGTGFTVSGGKARSSTFGAAIVRPASAQIQRLDVTNPTYVRIELLDSSNVVVGSVQIDSTVTVVGSTVATVPGGGSFSILMSNGNMVVQAADASWETQVDYSGVPIKVRVVALPAAVGAYLGKFGSFGTGNGQVVTPVGTAVDATGNIYVLDAGNHRVQKFSPSGVYISKFGSYGTGNGQFQNPLGIAVDSSGNIYVSDSVQDRVQKFNSSGVYVSSIGTSGTGNGQFDEPGGIALDSTDNLYVVDRFNYRVQKFNSSGTYVLQFGTLGSGDGQFNTPRGIAISPANNIYVTDYNNHRVQRFNVSGNYVSKFGVHGTGAGELNFPSAVGVSTGNIYVVDDLFGPRRTQNFNSAGVFQYQVGTSVQQQGVTANPVSGEVLVAGAEGIYRYAGAVIEASVGQIVETPVVSEAAFFFTADPVILEGEGAWLIHPTIPDLSVEIDGGPEGPCCGPGCNQATDGIVYLDPATDGTVNYAAQSTVHPILGSQLPVVVASGRRRAGTWSLILQTCDYVGRDGILAILDDQQPLLLQIPVNFDYDLQTGWYAVGDVDEVRLTSSNLKHHGRRLTLPMQPVAQPALTPTIGHTWGDLLTEGLTWQGVWDTYGTWINVLTGEPV